MKYSAYFNNNFLKRNYTVEKILSNYDYENGESDGKYSKAELRAFIDDAASSFGVLILGKRFIVNTIFELLDSDKVGQKDGYITENEMNWYLNKYAEISLDDIKAKTIKDACDYLDLKEKEVKLKRLNENKN